MAGHNGMTLAEVGAHRRTRDAAPELLAALKRSVCEEVFSGTLCAECRAEGAGCLRYAAIAKAEGGQ